MGEKLLLHTASKNFSFTKSILKQQSSQEVLLIGDEKKMKHSIPPEHHLY